MIWPQATGSYSASSLSLNQSWSACTHANLVGGRVKAVRRVDDVAADAHGVLATHRAGVSLKRVGRTDHWSAMYALRRPWRMTSLPSQTMAITGVPEVMYLTSAG